MDIIYEDKDIMVIEKPAGVPVQTKNITEKDTVSELKNLISLRSKSADPYLGIIHRLDKPVRGILVFALNEKAAGDLGRQIVNGAFNKRYHAYVEGPVDTGGEWVELTDYLIKEKDTAKIADKGSGKAKKAVLKYRTVKTYEDKGVTLLDIELITGRFHQIRIQLSNLGHPVTGDVKYGATVRSDMPKGTIGLCAYQLSFTHPVTGKEMTFTLSEDVS